MTQNLTIVDHPLIAHKLTILRDRQTPSADFRRTLKEIAWLLAFEAMGDLPLNTRSIETPIETGDFPCVDEEAICLVSVLRAGNGLLDGMLDVVPRAGVAHIGLKRDEETLQPTEYYFNAPQDLGKRSVIVVDPMLATGHSAGAAIDRLRSAGARDIRFVCLIAAPEGVAFLGERYPDVTIVTGALDRQLNEKGYITPGLGDAGDRIFGTD